MILGPSCNIHVLQNRRDLGFGSREKKGFGAWFKREERIWGFGSIQERRRDLGGLVQREKKRFRVLIQHKRRDLG